MTSLFQSFGLTHDWAWGLATLLGILIIAVPLLVIYLWPMSWWFDVRTVHVNDAKAGEQITMLVDREVKRPFLGMYYVTIHKWGTNGPSAHCRMQGGPWEYQKGAAYPVPLTPLWSTEGSKDCSRHILSR